MSVLDRQPNQCGIPVQKSIRVLRRIVGRSSHLQPAGAAAAEEIAHRSRWRSERRQRTARARPILASPRSVGKVEELLQHFWCELAEGVVQIASRLAQEGAGLVRLLKKR